MSKHKQPGGIWTAQYAHCSVQLLFATGHALLWSQCPSILPSSAIAISSMPFLSFLFTHRGDSGGVGGGGQQNFQDVEKKAER